MQSNRKKILSVLLALILALSVIPVSLSASAAESDTAPVGDYQGEREIGLVDPDYPDYEYLPTGDGAKIVYYNGKGGNISIPSHLGGYPVTSIGPWFAGGLSERITSVVIPDTVKTIERNAFRFCHIKSVTIPDSVTGIGVDAFYECRLLKTLTIPSSVKTIGDFAFCGCSSLEEVVFSSSLEEIGDMAFYRCVFLKSVELPDSVKTIGDSAFCGCTALRKITIPASVTEIGSEAFAKYGSKSSLYESNPPALDEDHLTSITVDPANTVYDSRENCNAIIETATDTLLAGCSKTVIPASVTAIGGGAFAGCTGLTKVDLPDDLDSIGEKAFCGCTGLTSVVIPDHVTEISGQAFCGCSSLTSVSFSEGLTAIDSGAFDYCDSLKSVTIPSSVQRIGSEAFGYHYEYGLNKNYFSSSCSWNHVVMDDFTMYGYYGTGADAYAADYADDGNIRFIGLNQPLSNSEVAVSTPKGMFTSVIDKTGQELEDSFGDPIDFSDILPGEKVLAAYDISLWRESNHAVPYPAAPIIVRIHAPQSGSKVYSLDRWGYPEKMEAVSRNGWLVFKAKHFSTYLVTDGSKSTPDSLSTLDSERLSCTDANGNEYVWKEDRSVSPEIRSVITEVYNVSGELVLPEYLVGEMEDGTARDGGSWFYFADDAFETVDPKIPITSIDFSNMDDDFGFDRFMDNIDHFKKECPKLNTVIGHNETYVKKNEAFHPIGGPESYDELMTSFDADGNKYIWYNSWYNSVIIEVHNVTGKLVLPEYLVGEMEDGTARDGGSWFYFADDAFETVDPKIPITSIDFSNMDDDFGFDRFIDNIDHFSTACPELQEVIGRNDRAVRQDGVLQLVIPPVVDRRCGDFDGDGEVTVLDVTRIQRFCASLTDKIGWEARWCGDVDCNGEVEVIDATYIQRYLAQVDTPYLIGLTF